MDFVLKLIFTGICHAGGAALLQQKKELILIKDVGPDTTFYQYTTVSDTVFMWRLSLTLCRPAG